MLRLLKPGDFSRGEWVLVELGLGAGALGLTAFALGLVGLLNGRLLTGILSLAALTALPSLISSARGTAWRGLPAAARGALNVETAVPLLFLSLAALYQLLIALGPVLFYDSLGYHLALPDLFLRRGAIIPTAMNVYAGIPAGVEMLYVWLLPLGGLGTSCQVLHLTLGLLAAATIVVIARRLGDGVAGVWAAAAFFTTPMVMLESGRPAVELGWSFYLALTLLALIAGEWKRGWREALLAGSLMGLALGTKFQAALLLPAVAAYFWHRFGAREGSAWAAKIGLVAVAVAAPWGLRNIFFYGNPIFPMLGGKLFAASPFVDLAAFMSSAHGRSPLAIVSSWDAFRAFVLHPWTYAMPLETSEADNVMSLAFLCALPLLPFLAMSREAKRLLLVAAVLWIPMNLLSGLARFNIPALVPLSLAAILPLRLGDRRRALAAGIAGAAVFGAALFYVHSKTDALLWRVLNGEIPVKTHLSHRRPIYGVPPFPAYDWANANLPRDAKLLLIGEPRSFYLDRDHETSSPYASQPIAVHANAASSGEDLYRRLKAAGFTYVYLNVAGMSVSRQTMSMSPQGLAALRDFWKRSLVAVFVDNSQDPKDLRFSVIYRILSEDEVHRPHPPVEIPFG